MTRLLACCLLAVCASCAEAATLALPILSRPPVLMQVTATADTVRLQWTMPLQTADGRPLSTMPLDYQVAYSTQSRTYVAHRWPIITDPDSAAFWWPTMRVEAAPLVVMSGTAVPGAHVSIVPVPVTSGDFPFSWWVRSRQRPNGEWSLWSNAVTRADNN